MHIHNPIASFHATWLVHAQVQSTIKCKLILYNVGQKQDRSVPSLFKEGMGLGEASQSVYSCDKHKIYRKIKYIMSYVSRHVAMKYLFQYCK